MKNQFRTEFTLSFIIRLYYVTSRIYWRYTIFYKNAKIMWSSIRNDKQYTTRVPQSLSTNSANNMPRFCSPNKIWTFINILLTFVTLSLMKIFIGNFNIYFIRLMQFFSNSRHKPRQKKTKTLTIGTLNFLIYLSIQTTPLIKLYVFSELLVMSSRLMQNKSLIIEIKY